MTKREERIEELLMYYPNRFYRSPPLERSGKGKNQGDFWLDFWAEVSLALSRLPLRDRMFIRLTYFGEKNFYQMDSVEFEKFKRKICQICLIRDFERQRKQVLSRLAREMHFT